jgi:hypothetical protein
MGLVNRKRSGNIIAGSKLIVPGQPILNVKKFEVTFNKKGSLPDSSKGNPPTPPPSNT